MKTLDFIRSGYKTCLNGLFFKYIKLNQFNIIYYVYYIFKNYIFEYKRI